MSIKVVYIGMGRCYEVWQGNKFCGRFEDAYWVQRYIRGELP